MLNKIETSFTLMFGIPYPIIAAPMFLVSNEEIVIETSEAGALGTFPALNYRPQAEFDRVVKSIKQKTNKPIGVNLIVNKSNTRQNDDLKSSLAAGVDLFITSLGNPKTVIAEAHRNGAKVFCDVTNLEHAQKVQDMGADGVIAVSSGAGGHAGSISPLVLIPWLKKKLSIPIVAAGGIADGQTMAAALVLGASAVSIGTRFIASKEATIDKNYKKAILDSSPEDIVMTTRLSGTPAAVIKTPYIEKLGTDLPFYFKALKNNPLTKKYVVPLIHYLGMKDLEEAATKPSWKTVWSAGQSVGLINDIKSCREIVESLVLGYELSLKEISKTFSSGS